MKFSSLTERISGESVDAWEVHYEGLIRVSLCVPGDRLAVACERIVVYVAGLAGADRR